MHLWRMFERLKHHWKVNNTGLFLILLTFAVTGTLTAYLSRMISEWLSLDKYSFAWWSSKILVLFFGYQVMILVVGFCFGMFSFFWTYEKKILRRMGVLKKPSAGSPKPVANEVSEQADSQKRIAIFASGTGSNAQKIIDHFRNSSLAKIGLIVCNNPAAGVLKIAEKEKISTLLIERNRFNKDGYVHELKENKIDFIILAGFLLKLPPVLIQAFPDKIVNIHPALLPNYGGKGMYGSKVHEAVVAAKEKQSGITIHYVDEIYDHGKIIFQATCDIDGNETAESLASKIHQLEHQHYPKIIEGIVSNF